MSEYQEQCSLVEWFRVRYPDRIINADMGGVRLTMGNAIKAKRAGHLKGYPDLFIAVAKGGYYGLFIEMKTKKGKASNEQEEIIKKLNQEGYYAIICYGFDNAMKTINDYMRLKGE